MRCKENSFIRAICEAILTPEFFASDGEMETITGIERSEYEAILAKIVNARELLVLHVNEAYALKAAIAQICGYPHGKDAIISKLLGVDIRQENAHDILMKRYSIHRVIENRASDNGQI